MCGTTASVIVKGVRIYKQSFTSKSTVLLKLAEAHYESEKNVASFEEGATKEEVLSKVSYNGV